MRGQGRRVHGNDPSMSRESLRNTADFSVYESNFDRPGGPANLSVPARKIPQQTILYRKDLQVKCIELGYMKWRVQACEILSVEIGPGEEPEIYFTWDPNRKDPEAASDQQFRKQATNELRPMRVGIQLSRGHDSICAQRTEVLSGTEQHVVEISGKSLTDRKPCTVLVAVITSAERSEIIRKLSAIEFPVAPLVDGKSRDSESRDGDGDGLGSSRASSARHALPDPTLPLRARMGHGRKGGQGAALRAGRVRRRARTAAHAHARGHERHSHTAGSLPLSKFNRASVCVRV